MTFIVSSGAQIFSRAEVAFTIIIRVKCPKSFRYACARYWANYGNIKTQYNLKFYTEIKMIENFSFRIFLSYTAVSLV